MSTLAGALGFSPRSNAPPNCPPANASASLASRYLRIASTLVALLLPSICICLVGLLAGLLLLSARAAKVRCLHSEDRHRLRAFEAEGFRFAPAKSDDETLVFARDDAPS